MTTSATRRAAFRAKVNERQGLLVPGAFNAMSARVIEDAGFEAIYITGAGVTNMSLGLPTSASSVSRKSPSTPRGFATRSRCH